MSSTSYKFSNLANTAQQRPELKNMGSEHHYATMIMGYLVDGLLDRVADMDLRR